MTATKKEIFKLIVANSPEAFSDYNRDAYYVDGFKNLTYTEAAYARATYAYTYYGPYSAAVAGLAISGLYLGALLLAPALIPFGLGLASAGLKYSVATLFLGLAAFAGYEFVRRTYQQLNDLIDRSHKNRLTSYDTTLLVSTAIAGLGVVTMMYGFPALLPVLGGLGLYSKAAAAAALTTTSGTAGYLAFFPGPGRTSKDSDSIVVNSSTVNPNAAV